MSSDPDQPSEQTSPTDQHATPSPADAPPAGTPPMGAPNPWAVGAAPGWASGPGPMPMQMPAERSWNGFAITSFVLGLLGGFCCLWAVAIGFGIAALNTIPKRNERGKGLAIAGIVLSVVWLLGSLGMTVFLAKSGNSFHPKPFPYSSNSSGSSNSGNRLPERPSELNAFDLETGDCFVQLGTGAKITEVRRLPCSEPHYGEVLSNLPVKDLNQLDGAKPGDMDKGMCEISMSAYAKDPWAVPKSVELRHLRPDESDVAPGSQLLCLLVDSSGRRRGSLKQEALTAEQNAYLEAMSGALPDRPATDPAQDLKGNRRWAVARQIQTDVELKQLGSRSWSDKVKQPMADLEAELRLEIPHLQAATRALDPDTMQQELAEADRHQGHQQEVAVRAALGLTTDGGDGPAPTQSAPALSASPAAA